MRRAILGLVTLMLGCGSAWAQLPVTDKVIVSKTAKLKLDIHYPQTGLADLDRIFADDAKGYAADPDLNQTSEGANSGAMSYEIRRNDAAMFSVQVSTYSYYAGHAHGTPGMTSYNFLMPGGVQVFLPELVDGRRGLDRISELVMADLIRQLGTGDLQAIRNGANPRGSSFQNFVWLPDALEITFEPYEVAGYAQGEKKVRIPFSQLVGVIRPDPRASAPSFSCAAARSPIEKAICADAGLARLDRQLAERYADKLDLNEVPAVRANERPTDERYRLAKQAEYELIVSNQRAWLKERNQACPTLAKDCLSKAYRDRIKAVWGL
ncbi:MAG TPA: DUF3298 domain-containing protein [Rhizomicrobium sp.]|nr:DUF3298 domain-containing protein [Rhizomicrobium sp.]